MLWLIVASALVLLLIAYLAESGVEYEVHILQENQVALARTGGLWGARRMPLVYTGLAPLFIVLGKLFLIDLVVIDELLCMLLFLGFCSVFLWLSYFFQNAISGKPRSPGSRGFGHLHWPGRPVH